MVVRNELAASEYKESKDQITVAVYCNASGRHILPLFLVGKSKNPKILKNINKKTLPVYYTAQKIMDECFVI